MWTAIGIGLALIFVCGLYFWLRMPECPVCHKRGPVYPEEYGGYYCQRCQYSFDTEDEQSL